MTDTPTPRADKIINDLEFAHAYGFPEIHEPIRQLEAELIAARAVAVAECIAVLYKRHETWTQDDETLFCAHELESLPASPQGVLAAGGKT